MKKNNREIRLLIIQHHDSQSNFAKKLGCHYTAVSHVINGYRRLRRLDAEKWRRLLHCDMKTLAPIMRLEYRDRS